MKYFPLHTSAAARTQDSGTSSFAYVIGGTGADGAATDTVFRLEFDGQEPATDETGQVAGWALIAVNNSFRQEPVSKADLHGDWLELVNGLFSLFIELMPPGKGRMSRAGEKKSQLGHHDGRGSSGEYRGDR